jgi:hypothetical protein
MEFDINLESERGEVLATVGDPQNLLHRLLERSIAVEPVAGELLFLQTRTLLHSITTRADCAGGRRS